MLTNAQFEQFRKNGFINGGRVLNEGRVSELQDELARVIRERDRKDAPQPVSISNFGSAENGTVVQIVNIWEASAPFKALMSEPKILEEIAQLTGARELKIWHDQIQYKTSGPGGVNMWHQDAPYWPPLAPMTQVSAWVALDDVDAENGCMSMVSGSHQWGNQIAFLHTLKSFDAMPTEFDGRRIEVRLCPARKGEVHYHHALTWHGSHANTSARQRRAIAIHYMTEETRYVASGKHLLSPYIKVADGEVISGERFPTVWKA